jgi:hypothetical protein
MEKQKRKRSNRRMTRIDQNPEWEQLAKLNKNNREEIKLSGIASCYYCKSPIAASMIVEWIDNDKTALCPHCGIDAVLPDLLEDWRLDAMHKYWFETGSISFKMRQGKIVDVIDADNSYDSAEFEAYRREMLEAV